MSSMQGGKAKPLKQPKSDKKEYDEAIQTRSPRMNNKIKKRSPISPPKHRHDGSSPLPLGMDWSPPPKNWDGRNTIWPHDPRTGWSYCVMVPSWIVQTESKASSDSSLNPIVFYRIQVGIQSPEGVSFIHGILRRFSDFLNLYSKLKKAFPKKDIPSAPPKHALLRINSSRLLLEERRRTLEEWMGKLLSDIDISRSASMAAFLELEVAARSSFRDTDQLSLDEPLGVASPSASSAFASTSHSVTSEFGSENAYETSANKEAGASGETSNGVPEPDHDKLSFHSRKLSSDSIGSDVSSLRGSEVSISGITKSIWDNSGDLMGGEQYLNDLQILLPVGQRHKLNKLLITMQRRLVTAKTDMEDLIARLNQEMTVKDYLSTKVKDLEGELEVTRQKGKENLQQAILLERERITQMQWDMDELRRKYMDAESKLKTEQRENSIVELEKSSSSEERESMLQELDSKQEQIIKLQRHIEDVEMKSKADIKILVKEVKSLRSSQAGLKEMLNQSMKEKTELERVLQNEKQSLASSKSAKKKLLQEYDILRHRLQECSAHFLAEEEDKFSVNSSSISDALDLLETSDNRISLLIAEAQLLAQDDEHATANTEKHHSTDPSETAIKLNGDDQVNIDDEIRRMLANTIIDNAQLRKQLNYVLRHTIEKNSGLEKSDGSDGILSRKTFLNRFLER